MRPAEFKNERILISCLNWGKGHVARCIGLIEQLLSQNNAVIIAGDSDQILIFKVYFPKLEFIEIYPYPFEFKGKGDFAMDLWRSRKSLSKTILNESFIVDEIVSEKNISKVISDHRYGFFSAIVTSIFITHQLNLPLKWWQRIVQIKHEKLMKSFQEIWVMDIETEPLAGKLSARRSHKNVQYIGHYSRFMNLEMNTTLNLKVLVCNGPIPYDEQLLLKYVNDNSIVKIVPERLFEKYKEFELVSALNWKVCDELLLSANFLYAYCGYSTLMDAKFLNATLVLIPTKGQAEQNYLFEVNGLSKR